MSRQSTANLLFNTLRFENPPDDTVHQVVFIPASIVIIINYNHYTQSYINETERYENFS
jgi:hypothetical protein